MKKSYLKLTAAILAALTISFTSCDDDDSVNVPPSVVSVGLSSDNATATVYFSEGVYSANNATGALTDDNFTVALSGGDLTLESSTVTHTAGTNTATIALTYSGTYSDGSDLLTVSVEANKIYDEEGASAIALSVNDNLNPMGVEYETIEVTGNITSNTTWEEGNVYILTSRITVLDGVTLTIEPGVIVKGNPGTGSNATALLVARGGILEAEGTSEKPIIFTSVADNIIPGQINSPNLTEDLNGVWGGLIVLGKAPISVSGDGSEASIEGIPADDSNGKYGGSVKNDYSGTLRYISIRHGGTNIGEGNEINGLTLGGVGSATVIENIEIVANQDDGIEFFGGTVDVSNVLVWKNGDDAIDADQAWNGTIDNGIIINPGDEAFELDGPEGSYIDGNYTIQNFSVNAMDAQGLVDNDDNTNVDMNNIFFFGLKLITGTDDNGDPLDQQDFDKMPSTYTCTFANFEVVIPSTTTMADHFPHDDSFVTAVTARTVGADVTAFEDWTFADVNGQLSNF